MKPIVVLGDTREAAMLSAALARRGWEVSSSLTAIAPDRSVIDAHHPMDAVGPAQSIKRALDVGARRIRLTRRGWRAGPSDDWRRVADAREAASALAPSWGRVFLSLGRDRLTAFAQDDLRFFVVRVRGGAATLSPMLRDPARYLIAPEEGPFSVAHEEALFRRERIDAVVTRDDGGAGAEPKVIAARRLGLPVVMVSRPACDDLDRRAKATRYSWRAALRWALRGSD
ncbi:MAG: precorrin-6A/cobalt-precorrin-6A reductase [Pseudomonadota bacterium]